MPSTLNCIGWNYELLSVEDKMKNKLLVYLVGIAILFSNPHLEASASGAYSVGTIKTIPSNSAAILDPSKLIFHEVTGGLMPGMVLGDYSW